MTVITPGGPCLTNTQIAIKKQQEQFAKNEQAQNPALQAPGNVDPSAASSKVTSVNKTDGASRTRKAQADG